MPTGSKLTRFTETDVEDPKILVQRLNQFVTTLELRLQQLEGPLVSPRDAAVGEEVYAVTNATEKRAFDADAVTLDELADVLGTFLEDLNQAGRLS